MRVGILTFHRANNFGAVLQAYALLKYIQDEGIDCELIDYYPNNAIPPKYSLMRSIAHKAKCILYGRHGKNQLTKEKRFLAFRKCYFHISKTHYYGDKEILSNPPKYDVFISGSDQILNTTLTGCSEAYYLGFVKEGKKVSYASSFGRENISEDEKRLIREQIETFDCVSVREISGQILIEKNSHKHPTLVIDPVFLLNAKIWGTVCSNKLKTPDKYIFVYSMENSEPLEKLVVEAQTKYKLPVIVVRGGGQSGRIKGNEVFSCGPTEFLRYIHDAEYVITNSFHGTALSMIFDKKLFCVAHSTRNTRLENILNIVKKNDLQITQNTIIKEIDKYIITQENIEELLAPYILKSKRYLLNCLFK